MTQLTKIIDFEKVIKQPKVILDFFAVWCGPCKMLAPMLEKIEKNNPDWQIVKIDVDQLRELAIQYNIEAVPTLYFLKDGKVITKSEGFVPDKQIQKIIDKI